MLSLEMQGVSDDRATVLVRITDANQVRRRNIQVFKIILFHVGTNLQVIYGECGK